MESDALHTARMGGLGCFLFIMATPTLPKTAPKERADTSPSASADLFLPTDMRKEYLYNSGGFYRVQVDGQSARVLSNQLDDLEAVLGPRIYEKMLGDSKIAKCLAILKGTILSDGIEISPAITSPVEPNKPSDLELEEIPTKDSGATPQEIAQARERNAEREQKRREYEELLVKYEEEKKKHEVAKRIADVCFRALDNLNRPLTEIIEQMLDALAFGHKIAEVTYELVESDKNEEDEGLYYFKHIKVKPQKSVGFVVDDYMNLLGFKAAVLTNTAPKNPKDPTSPKNWTVGGGPGNEEIEIKVIPRDKFAVLTFRPKDEDPRGTSILRSVYTPWHIKQMMWPEYMRWLMNCAVPGLVGVTAPASEEKNYVLNPDGSIAIHPVTGEPITAPATDALLHALTQMRNASAIAIPHGADVKPISSGTTSEPFKTARDVMNEEIEQAMLLQTLATSDSRHNTRAASETHLSILDVLIYRLKSWVVDMIVRDILKPWMRYTFGEEYLVYMPNVTMGDTERREFATDAGAISQLDASDWFDISQIVAIDKQLGLPPRAEGWERRRQEQKATGNSADGNWHLTLAQARQKQAAEKLQTIKENDNGQSSSQARKNIPSGRVQR